LIKSLRSSLERVLRKLKGKSKKAKVKKKGKGERQTTPRTQRGEPRIEDRR
jgi:hypothetical protein